jgi:hypothetical protein
MPAERDPPAERHPDDLMDARDVGLLFKVSAKTVLRWADEGRMPEPSFRVGNVRRWTWRVIRAWKDLGGFRPDKPAPERTRPPKSTQSG